MTSLKSLLDVRTCDNGERQQNLVFNRTGRVGAAERTGFLYRSFLKRYLSASRSRPI